ncbi:hypothetical protein P7C70_g3194, partial [Phenoliferia sp. Uapishka_3]
MPSAVVHQDLYLCADGGGTSVNVAVADSAGNILSRGAAGPCNVLTVGYPQAVTAILRATSEALAAINMDGSIENVQRRIFKRVWLGLAGITSKEDEDAFKPFAMEAFGFEAEEPDRLKVTNDGHLLASPCQSIPHVDSAVVLVAGTGTVGFSFRKEGANVVCSGISGGWGYLLGDEGSAYSISRLAIRSLLLTSEGPSSHSPSPSPLLFSLPLCPPSPLALHTSLLKHFSVSSPSALISAVYRDHSSPLSPSFLSSEANRKIWIAEACRVVFSYAFGSQGMLDEVSREAALGIVREASGGLMETVLRLVRGGVEPTKAALALGGGLWRDEGYVKMLVEGLREKAMIFAEVVVVDEPAEAGVRALVAQDQ